MADKIDPRTGELVTANYGWTKPTVGASTDAWGGYINADLDGIDSTVHSIQTSVPAPSSTTPAMDGTAAVGTGTTYARADHIHPTDTSRYAATNPSGYITSAAVPVGSSTTPIMDGTAAVGVGTTWARGDHVHPVDASRYAASNPSGYQTAAQVTASLGNYLPLTGGTLTGVLNIEPSGGYSIVQLQNASAVTQGQVYWNASTSIMYFTNVAAASNFHLDTGGNCNAAPSASGNFVLTPGAGYQTGGGSWIALSDQRIKTVEGDYPHGLTEVMALRPVVYQYKGNDSLTEGDPSMHAHAANSGRRLVGLVAQEAEIPMPEMVSKRDGFIDGAAVTDLRTLDTGPLIFALVNAVKELAARVAELEAARG